MKILTLFFLLVIGTSQAKTTISYLQERPVRTISLEGKQEAEVVKAFHAIKLDDTAGKRCHTPAHRIRQTEGDRTILDASICYGCENIAFIVPNSGTRGMVVKDASAVVFQDLVDHLAKTHKSVTKEP